jgi:hypothetical protein
MSSRWFNTAVVVLWLATMSWLVTQKVLPPLRTGEPPSYPEIIEAQTREPPVGWTVLVGGRRIGWALTETKQQTSGVAEIHGRARFDAFPLEAVTPGWLQPFTRLIGAPTPDLRMDARSEMLIDTFGRLLRFDSAVRVEPWSETISMQGAVEGGQLQFSVRSGESSLFNYELTLPPKSLLSDALSPQSRLPGLHIGQSWSVPIFNPLWPSTCPIEIIRAKVEDTQPIFWAGTSEDAWLVVYRYDSGSGAGATQNPKGKLWVRRDGAVLRQEVMLANTTIRFDRMSDKEAERLVRTLGRRWWTFDGNPTGERRRRP